MIPAHFQPVFPCHSIGSRDRTRSPSERPALHHRPARSHHFHSAGPGRISDNYLRRSRLYCYYRPGSRNRSAARIKTHAPVKRNSRSVQYHRKNPARSSFHSFRSERSSRSGNRNKNKADIDYSCLFPYRTPHRSVTIITCHKKNSSIFNFKTGDMTTAL